MKADDIETVHRLLSIMSLSRQWPDLKPIHDQAYDDLREYQANVVKKVAPKQDFRVSGKGQQTDTPRMVPATEVPAASAAEVPADFERKV